VKRIIANSLSVIFQPLLMPTFVYLILFGFASASLPAWTTKTQYTILGLIFLSTFIIPIISLAALKYTGSVKGFFMEDRRERILPFTFISIYYLLTSYLFVTRLNFINEVLIACLVIISGAVLLLTIITLFWKISAHAIGMGGSLGLLLAISGKFPYTQLLYPIVILVILSGLVMTSRLYLNSHKPAQVWAGFFLGLIFSYVSLLYYIN
jgi:membrane-associated phospholipid phosphatase